LTSTGTFTPSIKNNRLRNLIANHTFIYPPFRRVASNTIV